MKTDKGYCTSEKETISENKKMVTSKKMSWFIFWDSDFADKVEIDLQGRELIQEDGKWFVVKKNGNNNEHKTINRNVNDFCEDILINQVNNKVAIISLKSDVCDDEVELNLGDYEIKIRDNKTYAVKKRPKYPKTQGECCTVLFPDNFALGQVLISGYKSELLKKFGGLLICRNAYWKIAGEQLGLDKPWEPNWDNLSTNHEFIKISKGCFTYSSRLLVFPTPEMRDAFYENFKDLIEKCKTLL